MLISSDDQSFGVSWGVLGASWARLGASWGRLGSVLGASWARLGASWAVLGASWTEKVANMAPTWFPKWNQNGEKINPKIDQNFDASWDQFLIGFWWIVGPKMEACWHQNGIENLSYLENAEKPQNIIIPIRFSWFFTFWELILGAKIHNKSIKK